MDLGGGEAQGHAESSTISGTAVVATKSREIMKEHPGGEKSNRKIRTPGTSTTPKVLAGAEAAAAAAVATATAYI